MNGARKHLIKQHNTVLAEGNCSASNNPHYMHQEALSLYDTQYREALNESAAHPKTNILDSHTWKINLLNKTDEHIYHT